MIHDWASRDVASNIFFKNVVKVAYCRLPCCVLHGIIADWVVIFTTGSHTYFSEHNFISLFFDLTGSILPPPLLEDDDDDWDGEDEEEVDGTFFQESGPPPLESDSDSGGWSDEDESNKLAAVTNGYHTMNSHNSLGVVKMFCPGRGRGLSQFR